MAAGRVLGATLLAGLVLSAARPAHAVSITCPANITADNTPGLCAATVGFVDPTVSGGALLECTSHSGDTFPVGTTTVSCLAVGVGGPVQLLASCHFTITVRDAAPPMVMCPLLFTALADTDPGQCGAVVPRFFDPITYDNCPGVTFSSTPPAGSPLAVGDNAVNLIVTDMGGNTVACPITVTVQDKEPPVATCPGPLMLTAAPGECKAGADKLPEPTASDNCRYTFTRYSKTTGFAIGTTMVTATVQDGARNTTTCDFPVIVGFPNGVDCDGDHCTDEGCTDGGVCTFAPRAPTTPDAIGCTLDNLQDALGAPPEPECHGRCLDRLEMRLAKLRGLLHDSQVGSPKKCRRKLAAFLRNAKKLTSVLQHLTEAGKLDPTARAERATSEAGALLARGAAFQQSYCPGG